MLKSKNNELGNSLSDSSGIVGRDYQQCLEDANRYFACHKTFTRELSYCGTHTALSSRHGLYSQEHGPKTTLQRDIFEMLIPLAMSGILLHFFLQPQAHRETGNWCSIQYSPRFARRVL